MLTITVSAFSQVAGGAVAPERLGELVARHRSALLGHEVGEQEPTLAPEELRIVDHHAVGLQCDPTSEEDPQLQPGCHRLACILP